MLSEEKGKYRYILLRGRDLARLEKGKFELEDKEFFLHGKWKFDKGLNRDLNDALMDYGNYSWYDCTDITEEKAFEIISSYKEGI